MSLPSPKLDDRTFEDLRQEALDKIPALCPSWTDFNPSDPGITLLELMAWMCETVLYRLNRVPDKNYVKFLELMGVKLAPPRPARTWVVFATPRGARETDLPQLPAGLRLSTKPGDGGQPVVFETTDLLNLTASRVIAMCSRSGERIANHTDQLQLDAPEAVPIFCGETQARHCLYLGHDQFAGLGSGSRLILSVELLEPLSGDLQLEWEGWDGEEWAPLIPESDETRVFRSDGKISFDHFPAFVPRALHNLESCWLRARLVGKEFENLPVVKRLDYAVECSKTADRAYLSTEDNPYAQPVDINRDFHLFGKTPKAGNICYIGCSLFERFSSRVFIDVVMSERQASASLDLLESLELVWEYYTDHEGWKPLGVTTASGVVSSDFKLDDRTAAMTRSGTVSFDLPADLAPFSGSLEAGHYLRIRLSNSVFSEEDNTAPLVSTLFIRVAQNPAHLDYYLRESYGQGQDLTPSVIDAVTFPPFVVADNEGPGFYLALNSRPANGLQRLYIQLRDQELANPVSITWQYRKKDGWAPLQVLNDGTNGFSQRGALDFLAPADWEKDTLTLDIEGYWLRANWTAGERRRTPELKTVYSNAVEAIQASSGEATLGSSNGQLLQSFAFDERPILPGPVIKIREIDRPLADDITRLKAQLNDDVIEEVQDSTVTALWVRWREVENFFCSGPDDRHYTLDLNRGVITFGDGKFGRIPPAGRDNVVAERYYTGGGTRGNVGSETVTVMDSPYPFVQSVRNIEPATGGADGESVEMAKLRGPWTLKHRDRAVTLEDFERLAKESSTEVALAKCFTEGNEVRVIVLPSGTAVRPRPSFRLIETVSDYLDARRLLTSSLRVLGPEYDDIVMEVDVCLTPPHAGWFVQVRRAIESALRDFVHPLSGGSDGTGWPMGRTVHLSEIYYLLEDIEGIEYVDKVRMKKSGSESWSEKIRLGAMSFPHLRELNITQV